MHLMHSFSTVTSQLLSYIEHLAGVSYSHAQDEVLAVSKKIVVRVEDLVKWTCREPPRWKCTSQNIHGSHKPDWPQDATSPQQGETESSGE